MKKCYVKQKNDLNTKLCFYLAVKISLIFNDTPIKSQKTTNTHTLTDINFARKALTKSKRIVF